MSKENLEAVRRWAAAHNAGGLDAAAEFWHEDIEMFDPPGLPDADHFVGKAAVRSRIESYFDVGWDRTFRDQELVDAGDDVVVMVWRFRGSAPGAGVPFDQPIAFAIRLEGGKLREVRQYLSEAEALEVVASKT